MTLLVHSCWLSPEAGDGTSTSLPSLKQGQGSSHEQTSSESSREGGSEESKPDEYLAPIEIVDVKGGEGSKPSKTKKAKRDLRRKRYRPF